MREVTITDNVYKDNLEILMEVIDTVIEQNKLSYLVDVAVRNSDVTVTLKGQTYWLGESSTYDKEKDILNAVRLIDVLGDINWEFVLNNLTNNPNPPQTYAEVADLKDRMEAYVERAFNIQFGISNRVADSIIDTLGYEYVEEEEQKLKSIQKGLTFLFIMI